MVRLRPMRAHADPAERDPLRAEQAKDKVLHLLKRGFRECGRSQTILVRHHHELVARVAEAEEGGNHSRNQGDLV